MKKKFAITGLILLSIILAAVIICFLLSKKQNNIIETFGNIEIRQVDLSFQVQGNIKNVFVEEGDYVKEGDLLAELDNRDYLSNYNKALQQKAASLAQKNEDLSRYLRNLPMCSDDTLSRQECITLLNKKDLSIAKYKQDSENAIYQKNRLDYTKLYAPSEGIITTRAQEKGAFVNANQTIYVMSLTKPVWVRTYVNERDLGNIKYGKKAKVLTDTIDPKTGNKKEFMGTIGYISPVAEFTPKTVQTEDLRVDLVYRIRVYIDEDDNKNYEFLRQGMPVTVHIDLNENENYD